MARLKVQKYHNGAAQRRTVKPLTPSKYYDRKKIHPIYRMLITEKAKTLK